MNISSGQVENGEAKKTRILVVDDHPLVRQGLAQFINQESDMHVYAEASDGYEALDIIEKTDPDVVIVDIEMKGLNGMDLVRNMKNQYPEVPVLMLSMHDEGLYAKRALNAGARGYLMKEEDPEKVVNAIRAIRKGDISVSDNAQAIIMRQIVGHTRKESGSIVDLLSDRELEVFKKIGEGYRTRHIAENLHLSPKTVESYKARLKNKLGLKDAAELARHASEWTRGSSNL